MRTEGFKNFARGLMILIVAVFLCKPTWAQHMLPRLPTIEEVGNDPITFMRPHYVLHGAAGANLTAPPKSALTPAQVRHAYGFDKITNQGTGQVIGIVDAYDDPNAEADLGVFSKQFGLPACTSSNGCFRKVYETGKKPVANANWSVEIALDIEWAHAIAPQATIVLVEANTNSFADLLASVDVAVRNGASVVSMSWTVGEFSTEAKSDTHFSSNGVTFLAASGDTGTGVAYPAASPYVVGVGGTSLNVDSNGNYVSETAWSGSGGGFSVYEYEPTFQATFGISYDSRGRRGAPDVSYNANPGTGFAIYDSVGVNGASGWFQIGGTSAGSPQWAALLAIANSTRVAARKANLNSTNTILYTLAKPGIGTYFHPVTQGTNGNCGVLCQALPGYDYVTGLGTPQSNVLIPALTSQH